MTIEVQDYEPDTPDVVEQERIYLELQRIADVLNDMRNTLVILDERITALEP